MKIDVIKIGNSKGIRIPKSLLEACDIKDAVEVDVRDGGLVLSPVKRKPREGWEESFKQMAANEDDAMLLPDHVSPDPEDIDWEW